MSIIHDIIINDIIIWIIVYHDQIIILIVGLQ
jgi:hypothetical protein